MFESAFGWHVFRRYVFKGAALGQVGLFAQICKVANVELHVVVVCIPAYDEP